MKNVTYVTAFLDLHEDRSKDKSFDTCFAHFQYLINANIPIVVFLSRRFLDRIHPSEMITIVPIELEELETYKETTSNVLPLHRTDYHDTKHFMILMNSKIEFVRKAMDIVPSSHYAWIDFSIAHVLRKNESAAFLHMVSKSSLKRCLLFPGCLEKNNGYSHVYDAVHWRFCGGFFIGDTQSLTAMYDLYRKEYRHIVQHCNLWEVNVWSILEHDYGCKPTWYYAGHDDSIIRFPTNYLYVVASLTTIPSRIHTSCKASIDSLLHQVDHIYLSVATFYKRFSTGIDIPDFFRQEPYCNKVTIVMGEDKGPATKYLGALHLLQNTWIFFCDDDQIYSDIVPRMLQCVDSLHVYQNRYFNIRNTSSGGFIHGYVGNLVNSECLHSLQTFPLPECAYHVDDQWMSIYYFIHNIMIRPTGIENYSDIYKTLDNHHELIGVDSLASLGTRDERVTQLGEYFNVLFLKNCEIQYKYLVGTT